MTVATSFEQHPEGNGLSLVAGETVLEKEHVGPEETERLMRVGAYNARILACKRALETLGSIPVEAFQDQGSQLRSQIDLLRAERDRMIFSRSESTPSSTLPHFENSDVVPMHVVAAPAEPIEIDESTLPDQLAKLEELALSFVALAQRISGSLDDLEGAGEDAFAVLDSIFDFSEMVSDATNSLTEQGNEVIDWIEHADSQMGEVPAEVAPEADALDVQPRAPSSKELASPAAAPPTKPARKPKKVAARPQEAAVSHQNPPVDKNFEKKLAAIRKSSPSASIKPKQRGRY